VDAWEKWEEEEAPISPIHYFSWIFDVFLIVAFIGRYRTLLLFNFGPMPTAFNRHAFKKVKGK